MGVPFREAASQSALEAWTILIAIRFWKAKIRGDKLLIKSDSIVALAIMKKLSSGSPTLNWVGAELSIELEALQVSEVVAHHLPGQLNKAADWLSRPDTRGAMPEGLVGVTVRVPNEAWALESSLPAAGVEPSLWGRDPSVSTVFEDL
eukprot:s5122_g5.t1